MTIKLEDIPGLDLPLGTEWQIKAVVINKKSPAIYALSKWKETKPNDYKAIIKVLKLASVQNRVIIEKHVKQSANKSHGEVFEARAHRLKARLMFFYDDEKQALICTHGYEKGNGDQNAAFGKCATYRDYYFENKK